jgi:hypothetical protein
MLAYVCTQLDEATAQCTQWVQIETQQSPFPPLTFEDGALIAFAIVGVWTVGLAARVIIRAAQAPSQPY